MGHTSAPSLAALLAVIAGTLAPEMAGAADPASPLAVSTLPGCVGFCARLTEKQRQDLEGYVDGITGRPRGVSGYANAFRLEEAIARAESHQSIKRWAGYGLQGTSKILDGIDLDGIKHPAAHAVAGPLRNLGAWGLEKAGDALEASAARQVAIAAAIHLDSTVNPDLIKDGQYNRTLLSRIPQSKLDFLYSAEFSARLGRPELLQATTNKITAAQLSLLLQDTTEIRGTLEDVRTKIEELDKGFQALVETSKVLEQHAVTSAARLDRVETSLEKTQTVVESVAAHSLPAKTLLALNDAGALNLDEAQREVLEARKMSDELAATGARLQAVGQALSAIDGLEDAGAAVDALGSLTTLGGQLGLAVATQDVFTGAQAAFGIVNVISGFGRKKGPSAEARMLHIVFQEIRKLSAKIDQYHDETMARMDRVDRHLDEIDATLRRMRAELNEDMWVVAAYVDDIGYEPLWTCSNLRKSFLARAPTGNLDTRAGFARWFELEGVNRDWDTCMTTLRVRLDIPNETKLSMAFFVHDVDDRGGNPDFDDRKRLVRDMQAWVLQPAIRYSQKHALDAADVAARKGRVFAPVASTCGMLGLTASSNLCRAAADPWWRPSRVRSTQFNPGNGLLFSTARVLDLAQDVRVLAPMNTSVIEDPERSGLTVVIPKQDFGTRFSHRFLANRTRHLTVLMGAIDLLDVTIAQAHVIAGTPMIDLAAQVIDERVLPAYARAQLQGNSQELDEMLQQGHRKPDRAAVGPRCATGALAYDTLCLMQTNRWFRDNVMRAVVLRRLHSRGESQANWLRTVRLPFSPAVQSLLGSDVILRDASSARDGAVYAQWAVELPRVNLRADVVTSDSPIDKTEPPYDCWESRPVDLLGEAPYAKRDTAYCALLPSSGQQPLDSLSYPFDMHALIRQRRALQSELESLCRAMPDYPTDQCGWARQATPDVVAASSVSGTAQ